MYKNRNSVVNYNYTDSFGRLTDLLAQCSPDLLTNS